MKTKTIFAKSSAIVAVLALTASGAFAAATASDTAANYAGVWSTTPSSLGSGFGAWSITAVNNTAPPYSGTYLDQTSYGNSDAVLNSGYAWGTYANGGDGSGALDMVRAFNTGSGSASLVNQTFSVGLGSGGIGGQGSSIVLGIGTAFTLSYAGGGPDNFALSVDGGAATAVPVDFAQLAAGIKVSLTVSGALNSTSEGYALAISPVAGGPAIYTGTGTFDSATYNTSSFSYADNNTSNDQFVNDLNITAVPEPSSMLLFGSSGLVTLLAIRRRK
ncbi:exported hypothetical protein [Verrucomicrobia bacterium]|nr:exported hypothetical protein [Verrucomicrobiota bacterium]